MKTKERKLVPEIQIIQDKAALTVTTIKKKFVDQMQKLEIGSIADVLPKEIEKKIDAVGWYRDAPKDSLQTYDHLLMLIDGHYFRVDLYIICSHLAERNQPDLWNWPKDEKQAERTSRYEKQRAACKLEVVRMQKHVPQLFTE